MNREQSAADIGARLKDLRLRRGLTLETVATPLGVTRSCVSQWESGRSPPRAKYFEQLAATLNTSVSFLLTGANEQSPEARAFRIEAPDVVLRARRDIADALGVHVSKVRVEIDQA